MDIRIWLAYAVVTFTAAFFWALRALRTLQINHYENSDYVYWVEDKLNHDALMVIMLLVQFVLLLFEPTGLYASWCIDKYAKGTGFSTYFFQMNGIFKSVAVISVFCLINLFIAFINKPAKKHYKPLVFDAKTIVRLVLFGIRVAAVSALIFASAGYWGNPNLVFLNNVPFIITGSVLYLTPVSMLIINSICKPIDLLIDKFSDIKTKKSLSA